MKGLLALKKTAAIATMCMAVLCLPGYSEPTPEQIAERTKLLVEAVKNDDVAWVKLCINNGAYVNARVGGGKTVLMYAISKDVADVLIKSGADVNAKDNNGSTALMVIADKARLENYYKSKNRLKDVAELLIKSGADVNAKDNNGCTALMIIVDKSSGVKDVAELLINLGADVNAKDNDGYTALMIIADKSSGIADVAKLLINSGADVNAKSYNGRTALSYSISRRNLGITNVLQAAGATE